MNNEKTQLLASAAESGSSASQTATTQPAVNGSKSVGDEMVEPYINKTEVARRLQKTVRTVDNLMARGILPYYKIGRSVVFKWSEVGTHLAQTCRVLRS